MPERSDAALEAAIGRRPQRSSEIIGSGDRRSCRTNRTTATTATRSRDPDLKSAGGRKGGEISHDRGDGDGEKTGAQMIDLAPAADAIFVQISAESHGGERADRQVDPKDPGPGQVLDNEPAGQWPDDRRQRPNARQPALYLGPLVHRIEVADDGHRGRLNRARANALREPEDNERGHRPRESAENRAKQEDHDANQHHPLSADEIGELAEHHCGRGLRQKKRGEHPTIERQPAQLADNLRHGGRDDGRLDRDHEIRRHNGGEHKRTVSRQGRHGVFLGGYPSQ